MLSEFSFANYDWTLFALVQWISAFFCSGWLALIFLERRHLYLKPSMQLLAATHLFLQWPAALFAPFCEHYLFDSWVVALLVQGYMFSGLLWSSFIFTNQAKALWMRMSPSQEAVRIPSNTSTLVLVSLVAIISLAFFSIVPFRQSGLYALLFDPQASDGARELSYNMLPSWMKYALSFSMAAIVPFLFSILTCAGWRAWKERRLGTVAIIGALMLLALASVSVTGARYPAVKVLLAGFLTFLFLYRLPFSPLRIGGAILLVLFPAALITLSREGQSATLGNMFYYLFDGIILHRVLSIPLQVGLWHIHFAEWSGFFGPGAVRLLAKALGEEVLTVPTLIGQQYLPDSGVTAHADAGYLFTYYSYFGMTALPLAVGLLMALDSAIFAYLRLRTAYLIPALGAIGAAVLEFVQSDFTTVLLSHGFVPVILLALFCQTLDRAFPKLSITSGASASPTPPENSGRGIFPEGDYRIARKREAAAQ